ncbi:hypothetical protein D9M68_186510 [compost metagenome]
MQIVEVRERVEEIGIQSDLPFSVPTEPAVSALPLISRLSTDEALSIGVPEDWIKDVLGASEDKFFALAGHLPQEAAEALLDTLRRVF